ncbi:MAG TPA: hypothetical protein VFN49_10255 [Candidatus Aquilonibacter sp.]|nr:hypothetical protein [Candidatus Aquilonibacter sp.]
MHLLRSLGPAAFIATVVLTHLSASAASTDPFAGLPWRPIGPAISGGRIGAVAGTDSDPSLYYVGAAGGGLWKSTNGGASWQPLFDAQDVQSIGAIAIDPTAKETVWVGTGESNPRNDVTQGDGIYKTTDGGKHFTKVLPLQNSLVGRIVVDPRAPSHVVVAVLGDPFADTPDRGVYRTTDGGTTWKKTLYLGPSSGASDLISNPTNPDELFAGMWQYRRTGWSSDSGGPNDGLYRSNDGGATWTRLSGDGLPSETMGRIGLAISRANPQRIFALIETKHGLLWRSDDGGKSWSMVNGDPLIDERPFYYSTIFADPANADRLWAENVHMTMSVDGGKHFTIVARNVHGDHHEMWLSSDGRRIIEGNDGGVVFSRDGGATWQADKNLPISQAYHVGYSRATPYDICLGLQDNGMWCAPANPLSPSGISSSQWQKTGGGDGTWVLPEPRNPRYVWQSAGGQNFGGEVSIHDRVSSETREVGPYVRDQNVMNPADLHYRFNWETPIAFDPFDSKRAFTAANVVFATTDRGMHWNAISPDLTRNDKAHQVVTGGVTLDGTGAETSDTILAIEPSHVARGEIWIGTDDGLVQLTRDDGKHWTNVTPPGLAPWGRFASISASRVAAGTAYAVYDVHMTGDRAPHVLATHDYGAHWRSIDAGLPRDDEARSILADPTTPHLLYLGLERSLWASWDDGSSWSRISSNLPAVSVRDIRMQPDRDDLLLATHGRGAWVMDDASALQHYEDARRAGIYLVQPRRAIEWNLFNAYGTSVDGEAPPYGAIFTYYLDQPAVHPLTAEIVDARGRVVRRFATHEEDGKAVPDLTNRAGFNRFTWDLTGEDVHPWTYAPAWNRGSYDAGAPAVPGKYSVRLHVDGRILTRSFTVGQDPRTHYTQTQLTDRHARIQALLDDLSRVDDALNELGDVAARAPAFASSARAKGDSELETQVSDLDAAVPSLIASLTSNPKNDQDDDFLRDVLRERLQTQIDTYFDSFAPATAAQREEDARLHALTRERLGALRAWRRKRAAVDERLRARGLGAL